jgi:hypothetical protein
MIPIYGFPVTRQLSGRKAIRNAPELAHIYLLIELGSENLLAKPLSNNLDLR